MTTRPPLGSMMPAIAVSRVVFLEALGRRIAISSL